MNIFYFTDLFMKMKILNMDELLKANLPDTPCHEEELENLIGDPNELMNSEDSTQGNSESQIGEDTDRNQHSTTQSESEPINEDNEYQAPMLKYEPPAFEYQDFRTHSYYNQHQGISVNNNTMPHQNPYDMSQYGYYNTLNYPLQSAFNLETEKDAQKSIVDWSTKVELETAPDNSLKEYQEAENSKFSKENEKEQKESQETVDGLNSKETKNKPIEFRCLGCSKIYTTQTLIKKHFLTSVCGIKDKKINSQTSILRERTKLRKIMSEIIHMKNIDMTIKDLPPRQLNEHEHFLSLLNWRVDIEIYLERLNVENEAIRVQEIKIFIRNAELKELQLLLKPKEINEENLFSIIYQFYKSMPTVFNFVRHLEEEKSPKEDFNKFHRRMELFNRLFLEIEGQGGEISMQEYFAISFMKKVNSELTNILAVRFSEELTSRKITPLDILSSFLSCQDFKPIRKRKSKNNRFNCRFCSYVGITDTSLKAHTFKNHNQTELTANLIKFNFQKNLLGKCMTCGEVDPTKDCETCIMEKQLSIKMVGEKLICIFCNQTFEKMTELRKHNIEGHEDLRCKKCGLEIYKNKMMTHLKNFH